MDWACTLAGEIRNTYKIVAGKVKENTGRENWA
jgi:hypothetical protein